MTITSTKPTLENDGSVSDDPCQECEGRLILRNVRSGGFFLGCSNFPTGCTWKMAPNPHQMEELALGRAERKTERARKRMEGDRIEREEYLTKKRREEALAPKFCDECYSSLSNVDKQAGLAKHRNC